MVAPFGVILFVQLNTEYESRTNKLAIVQISQITNRKGLQVDLPQLAGAELGWSIDSRRLFIGNGTLEEGAPVIGNTEILTEFSDILAVATAYTYQGADAGYTVQTGPTPGTPIEQSLQTWLDQFATVKDFGAVGDGVADDTAAINRALYQLYCREVNPQIRRSLFFPAGIYRVTQTIKIPPYATLYGEGIDNSVIRMDNVTVTSLNDYVARTADSLQQTGPSIGSNGASPPEFITITNLGFENLTSEASVFLIEAAENCRFQNVGFEGPLLAADLTTEALGTSCVEFASTPSLICNQVVFDSCRFGGTVWATNTDQQIQGITFTNSKFNILYHGIVLGAGAPVSGGATGVRITGNMFDNVYAEGIIFGDVSLNASGHNIFYNVGNYFGGIDSPRTSIIDIQNNNNVSISDLFTRTDNFATTYPRVQLNNTLSIATTNGSQLSLGSYTRKSGLSQTLINNTTATLLTFSTNVAKAFQIDYTIVRDVDYLTGTLTVTSNTGSGLPTYSNDYIQNADTGISFAISQGGSTITVNYTATNTGLNGSINYSIRYLV